MTFDFEEISILVSGVPVGLFDGQFYYDEERERIEWIALHNPRGADKGTAVIASGCLFDKLSPVLMSTFSMLIDERISLNVPSHKRRRYRYISDPHSDFRLSKAQLGLRT